jgi:hypothetical protein
MTDKMTIKVRRNDTAEVIEFYACETSNGNFSFEYAGMRHILKPDGQILQMISYAYERPSWERSPVLQFVPDE